jgi:hypothetical protein
MPAIGRRPPAARQVPLPLPGPDPAGRGHVTNGILVADASGILRRVPSSATASMSNSPHGGSGAVPCTACNVLMKAVTNGLPQWFERLAN